VGYEIYAKDLKMEKDGEMIQSGYIFELDANFSTTIVTI